ncbi:MAG: hypothetical protein BWX45_00387 [Deltaproteobacteria bacterium ADurb.Bin002]|nr:MAG: hypothetical protein BWX45_00387 [Deltaproteobacteria bacterium ADurb.Bin002]
MRPHAVVQELDIIVGDHDRVVHHHAQYYDQGRKRDLVQFNAEKMQQREGHGDRHGNRRGGDGGDTERKQENDDQDHRGNGQYKLKQKMADIPLNDSGLVDDRVQFDAGRKPFGRFMEFPVHRLSKGNNVVSFMRLNGKQDAAPAVDDDFGGRLLEPPLDAGHIPEADDFAGFRETDNLMADLLFRFVVSLRIKRDTGIGCREIAGRAYRVLRLEDFHHLIQPDSIERHLRAVGEDDNLLLLLAEAPDFRHLFHGSERVFQFLRVVPKLGVPRLVHFDGNN